MRGIVCVDLDNTNVVFVVFIILTTSVSVHLQDRFTDVSIGSNTTDVRYPNRPTSILVINHSQKQKSHWQINHWDTEYTTLT